VNPKRWNCGTSVSQFIYLFTEGLCAVVQGHSLYTVFFLISMEDHLIEIASRRIMG